MAESAYHLYSATHNHHYLAFGQQFFANLQNKTKVGGGVWVGGWVGDYILLLLFFELQILILFTPMYEPYLSVYLPYLSVCLSVYALTYLLPTYLPPTYLPCL